MPKPIAKSATRRQSKQKPASSAAAKKKAEENPVRLNILVPPGLYHKIRLKTVTEGTNISKEVRRMIEDYVS